MESARTANVLPDVATIPVLLKLHGDLKAPQQWLLRSYIKHLPAGSLHVAYHVNEPQSASQQLAVSMLEGSGVHVCTFTTKAVETVFKAFFSKARKRADELGWKTFYVPNNYPDWPNLHSMVLPTVVNWWRQLGDRRLQFKHVWVVEGDALFVGSGVAGFFESFRSDQRDLLSTGFHLAGPGWWAYPLQTFGRTLTARRSNLTRFGLELGKGRPPAWAANWRARESGLLFRLTPVERYSSRLLAFAEDSLLRRGEGMHSEAFASSLCADASSWCTLGDWANSPTGQSNSFRSKFYSPFRRERVASLQRSARTSVISHLSFFATCVLQPFRYR
uniref:Uncharacterized protein n=1 Tax=Chrysotila carterae TaxID=13221 RepID=A0A7S4B1F8_CHRCT